MTDSTTTQRHCAKFSKELWTPMRAMAARNMSLDDIGHVYDPMAGVGTLEEIFITLDCFGSELEPEYAAMRPWIKAQDCMAERTQFGFICTSPPYGNRFADQYLGTPEERRLYEEEGIRPRRHSYAQDLQRKLTDGSAAAAQWGPKYRFAMAHIWEHVVRWNVAPEGWLMVNVASHYRANEYQPVAPWTLGCILEQPTPMRLVDWEFVETPGLRDGQNNEARVGGEHLFLFRKS